MTEYLTIKVPLKKKQCAVCGKKILTTSRGLYCSNACKQKAARLRDPEKHKAWQKAWRERMQAAAKPRF